MQELKHIAEYDSALANTVKTLDLVMANLNEGISHAGNVKEAQKMRRLLREVARMRASSDEEMRRKAFTFAGREEKPRRMRISTGDMVVNVNTRNDSKEDIR